jgi:hypothetical protein
MGGIEKRLELRIGATFNEVKAEEGHGGLGIRKEAVGSGQWAVGSGQWAVGSRQ